MSRVAIVSLGRAGAMGEVRRVTSWRSLFEHAGAQVLDIAVQHDHRPRLGGLTSVLAGRSAPERLAWSGPRLRAALAAAEPDVVIAVSTRAFDPKIVQGPWTVVLDHVDSLARSYRDRAAVVDGLNRRVGYRALARQHTRVEEQMRAGSIRRVAAGWSDALRLGAEWVPNLIDPALAPSTGARPETDLLFVGTLRYPPNVDALEHLACLWPLLQRQHPEITALIAGADPTRRVVELCDRHAWQLASDFDSLSALAARARVAVAPLRRTAGLQNKVLDAAALALPQVASPQALEGFDPGFPLTGQPDDEAFVGEVGRLLDDPGRAQAQAHILREHVETYYGAPHWMPWARDLIDHST